jgi:hypothetical protein
MARCVCTFIVCYELTFYICANEGIDMPFLRKFTFLLEVRAFVDYVRSDMAAKLPNKLPVGVQLAAYFGAGIEFIDAKR